MDPHAAHSDPSPRDEQTPHAGHASHADPSEPETQAGHAEHDAHAEHDTHASHAGHDAHAEHDAHAGHDKHARHDKHAGHGTSPGNDAHAGHDKHAGHSPEMFRRKFWGSLALGVGVLAFDPHFWSLFGKQAPFGNGAPWVAPLLGTALYVYGGAPFLKGAVDELRIRRPGMMTLVALGITVAYVYSLAVALGWASGMALWWELATLVVVMVLGHWIEMASVQRASHALDNLAALVPATAHRLQPDGSTEEVPLANVGVGDRLLVRPGEQVPADGRVQDGASSVNEAFLTGESRPVSKAVDDEVVAGSINGEGALTVEVLRTGEATTLSQIQRLIADAQASRSRYEGLADRAAGVLFYVAVGAGAATFVGHLLLGLPLALAVERTITVLVMACPHALGLAIPLVIANATALAARNGLLLRNREAFERARDVRVVGFDKTGTLTEGRFGVTAVVPAEGIDADAALRLTAALEARSEHPLAAAILAAARQHGLAVPPVEDFDVTAGKGVSGRVEGKRVWVGRPGWETEFGLAADASLGEALHHAEARGESAVILFDAQRPLALVSLADQVRPSAREAVAQLKALGLETVMITGDADAVAQTMAQELGLTKAIARVLPAEKAARVRELRTAYGKVAFVGDGINDAPALLEADLGIAIGAGTNVAIESADVVLVENDPVDVVRVLRLSDLTYRKMRQNLFWATSYNVVALPLAAGLAAPWGITLTPAAGAVFMSLSTLIVAANALSLRRARL
ncbi:MAG: copper-translocating P-type ATPase [Bacteroidetes bacterium]|nr:copper-translocating P-type ATPase [Bacteroidota bacterium]